MGIFESIKNAFGGKAEADVVVSPSQMLRDAGLDPSGLKFNFSTTTIAVSGQISNEADRQKILDVLAGAPGISTVQDNMTVSVPAAATPTETPDMDTGGGVAAVDAKNSAGTYTVQSGDTLWKIAQEKYGDGSKYMKIFEANTGLLKNPDQIFPGQVLVIPEL